MKSDSRIGKAQTNSIGLDRNNCYDFAFVLNELLANYSIFYQNVSGYSWHIRGFKFFELQSKFKELQSYLNAKVDELAERILILGASPNHTYSMHIADSDIEESKLTSRGDKAVEDILNSLQIIMNKQRHAVELAQEIHDQSSTEILQRNILEQERLIWIYSAFLNQSI